ncbi:MAG: aldo/keto reductase [Anaerolineales bacterium]|jgi:aryl-alcohol dehydrogenase-like predicted oxidoreductase|nr:aldo/keto reductase [Anaerolineales bacterium]
MQTRKLGYSELNLTTVGFGAWAIGGGNWDWGWGPQDDAESISTIHRALDLGINWIDTAAAYGLGHSEEIVARALKGRRDQVFLATKCSLVWDTPQDYKVYNRLKAWSVRRECENSLRRLNTEVIDLYQIHWPNPDADIEEGWTEIARLIDEGKVRYGGVSNFSVQQMRRAQAIHPIASLQPEYSMLAREPENELLAYCAENQIGVIAYSPMASGLLTGKYNRQKVAALPPTDWRVTKNEYFREPSLTLNLEMVESLRPIAERNNHSLGELAVAWVLRRPEVTAAIVGARRPDQIAETAMAGDWTLSTDEQYAIEKILEGRQAKE